MMKKINYPILILLTGVGFLFLESCYKDAINEPNPFEENTVNQDTVSFVPEDIDPNSIAGLYQNIFGPTCANVGCHDGTFEPDFRTIESSYHSMVYQLPIKDNGNLTYRVDPGNPNQSAIMRRLDGTILPPMPIEIEPDSEWWEKEDEFIQNVKNWIENGALDLNGNAPQLNHINPTIMGVVAKVSDTLITRLNGFGPIIIPDSADHVDIYFAFDPINNPDDFSVNEFTLGYGIDEFTPDITMNMEIMDNPIGEYGLYGEAIFFTHKMTLDLSEMTFTDDHVFFRIRVQDGSGPTTEIPSDNGLYYIKEYMSFIRTD